MNLVNTIDNNVPNLSIDAAVFNQCKTIINDREYFKFIEKHNGGFFYGKSLSIYSLNEKPDYRSITQINKLLSKEYQEIITGIYCFGQDIFGNQFAFYEKGILFLNIESGDREHIADNFLDWVNQLENDLDYLTGLAYLSEWEKTKKRKLAINGRLCPKIPFVIGGEYSTSNFYEQIYPKYIETNANIAQQIFNLPDGTTINLNTEE